MPRASDDTETSHVHPGEDITSGQVGNARIANLPALGTTPSPPRTTNVNMATEVTGALADANIAAMGATKLTGTINIARVPDTAKKLACIVSLGNEASILSTGTATVTFRIPFAFSCDEVRATLSTAGTGAALVTVDINDDGVSMLTTKITIDATQKTSETATTASALTTTPLSIADDSEITVDIDTIDTDNVAAGLKIEIIGQRA